MTLCIIDVNVITTTVKSAQSDYLCHTTFNSLSVLFVYVSVCVLEFCV